jgi:FKBP-type peptidyl-prolyl cis-trans isomerase
VHDGNVIALAFNGPPLQVGWDAVQARAAALQASLKLPTKGWAEGLRSANVGQEAKLAI